VLPVRYMVDLFTCVWNTTMASDNITCSLPNATCTENPTCQSGLCAGTPKLCPGDQCNAPTTCSLTTGCINPLDPTGTLNIPCSKQCFDNSVCGSAGFCLGVTYNASQPGCLFGGACEVEWLLSALDFN
jgi:hypothetical protein